LKIIKDHDTDRESDSFVGASREGLGARDKKYFSYMQQVSM